MMKGWLNMNALSINIPANFVADCNNTLARYYAAQTDTERRAVLDRQQALHPLHERQGAEARNPSHSLPWLCMPGV